ncbi:MAG: hypothetical protein M0Z42_17095, partial [Actinomycetota bacterium]|nr:hypothetical protein [Actinomycetota bacterium]
MSASPGNLSAELERRDLVCRIRQAATAGAVVLAADAGYGKTTLFEQAFGHGPGTAWVECTQREREAGQLVARIATAIDEAVAGAAEWIRELLARSNDILDPVTAVHELLIDVRRLLVDPLTIILDQAEHVSDDAPTLAVVDELLRAGGGVLRVAVGTRTFRGLHLAKLRNEGRVEELTTADLAFDAAECRACLELATGVTPREGIVEDVMATTEGWPMAVACVGLMLGRRLATGSPLDDDGLVPLRSLPAIRAFLTEEVLDGLGTAMRAAVIDSSVCRYLNPPIAARLGLGDDFVESVMGAGLFLRRVGAAGEHAYHPLFLECLVERLAAERSGEELAALHRRAAVAMAEVGETVDAIEHLLEAQDWETAAAMILSSGTGMLGTSPDLVRHWLHRLPATSRAHLQLRLLSGTLAWLAGDLDAAVAELEPCAASLDGDPRLRSLAIYKLMEIAYVSGRLEDAVQLAACVETLESIDPKAAAGVTSLASICLASLGRAKESEEMARRSGATDYPEDVEPIEVMRRAHLEIPAGRLDAVLGDATRALARLERYDPFLNRSSVLTLIAYLTTEQGELGAAVAWWRRVEGETRHGLVTRLVGPSQAWQALLHAQLGSVGEAESLLATASPPPPGWTAYIHDVARAVVAAHRGRRSDALAAARRATETVRTAPAIYRAWAAADLVPALVQVGAEDMASSTLAEATAAVDTVYPGAAGAFTRARLGALAAWLAAVRGETEASDQHLVEVLSNPVPGLHYVLVREWPRLHRLVWSALDRSVVDVAHTMRLVTHAFPDGLALVPFLDHPDPAVRRLAIAPALASGHPDAAARVAHLADDIDRSVAAAARATSEAMILLIPPRAFTVLGGFSVRRGAWVVDDKAWGRPAAPRLVRYLLVHSGKRVPEEVLFEVFWPDLPPTSARRSLQVAASRVRAALDHPGAQKSLLSCVDGTYRLELGEADVVDAFEFERAAARALGAVPTDRAR